MPPVSEAQRRAMRAAAAGKSTLGIPKKVGAEFSRADPGGILPKKNRRNYAKGGNVEDEFASDEAKDLQPSMKDYLMLGG